MKYFPLFADLRDRRVLVVGGGVVAERKVRLLLDAGAQVVLVAPSLTQWLAMRAALGLDLQHVAEAFRAEHLQQAVLVIAATGDAEVNARVARAATERDLLVNVVDDAEASSFIVPAIVDRSPLVVAVSSGGAAPVLARRVRDQIENLLDESLGALAALLAAWRARVRAAVPDPAIRRRFYERLLAGAVPRLVRRRQWPQAEEALAELVAGGVHEAPGGGVLRTVGEQQSSGRVAPAAGGAHESSGRVILVGAGPGDPGLLTLNALRALQEADVVLYDRLVSDDVLQRIRRDATLVPVGKAAGHHSVPQQRIHELMVEHARLGRRVVRLKGGDPFVFGRGGEEIAWLTKHRVPFEVVPGVTAATACTAYAGIPLTHREHAQSVSFVTACGSGTEDRLDWVALATPGHTVAFYMGAGSLERIGERLLAHGRNPATPAVVIEDGTRSTQRVTLVRLGDLGDLARRGAIGTPALAVVGEVAALAADQHWFGAPPRVWDRRAGQIARENRCCDAWAAAR